MDWPQESIDSWEEFSALADHASLGSAQQVGYLFRGQADAAWHLTTSLQRTLAPDLSAAGALDVEARLRKAFGQQIHLHVSASSLPSISSSPFEVWMWMQHHGAPTRLLDWSASPYVGCYFAVESSWDVDGAVWLFHPGSLAAVMAKQQRCSPNDYRHGPLSADAPLLVLPYWPDRPPSRFVAQQGALTVCMHVLGNQEAVIEEALRPIQGDGRGLSLVKCVIPARLKPEFLKRLTLMNVTASALFPGIDGLGRSLAERARLTSHFPNTTSDSG